VNDKQILITGATNGIGLAAAEALAALGANLAIVGRSKTRTRIASMSMTDLREQVTIRITLNKAPETHWVLSFVNEDGGRQTRLEVTSASLPSEHALALARACAA
jgi:NAD(P)-dependent dehydrogenase (short-subunit alcohol dehydrogenase family)